MDIALSTPGVSSAVNFVGFSGATFTNAPNSAAAFLVLDDAVFRKRFAGTPVKRTGRDRVVRNALIAAGNSGDRSLLPAVEGLLSDPSPLVRAMAVWALQRLAEPEAWAAARRKASLETDADVSAEWAAAEAC